MKYALIIIGSGNNAETHLSAVIEGMTKDAQEIYHASVVVGGVATPKIGTAVELDELFSRPMQITGGESDPTLHEKLDHVKGLLERLVEDGAKPAPKPRAKKGPPEPDTGSNPSPALAAAPEELPPQDAQGEPDDAPPPSTPPPAQEDAKA